MPQSGHWLALSHHFRNGDERRAYAGFAASGEPPSWSEIAYYVADSEK
jgi:hypothetical protein